MSGVEGLTALVTGGGRGIGAAIAAALTREGAKTLILGRNASTLQEQVKVGNAADYYAADIGNRIEFERALAQITATAEVDILVNNAGAAMSAPFLKTTNDDFKTMIDINLMGPVIASKAILPGMIGRRFGRIINIASTAALKGYAYVSAYVAAKHAVLGLTKSLALETANTGVTVNAVCPGFTDTDMVQAAIATIVAKTGRKPEDARAELARTNPMGRLIHPDEVSDAVLFLARRESAAITGVALAVSGGEI